MDYIVCSLFDEKTCLFGAPMLFVNLEEAKRYFSFIVNEDKNRLVSKDLVLYHISHYDSVQGTLYPLAHPEKILSAYEVMGGSDNV